MQIRCEASAGGGIPIVNALEHALVGNEILTVAGILNGTTNYILSRMAQEGLDFAEVLADAQRLGYAEANPSADVDGFDAASKVAILSSISNVQRRLNPKLKIEGFLLTMYDARTQLGNEISSEVRSLFKENTFLTQIPRNQSIVDSQASQTPVTAFKPSSQGAAAYFSLARELLDRERGN